MQFLKILSWQNSVGCNSRLKQLISYWALFAQLKQCEQASAAANRTAHFSLKLYETTLSENESSLLAYLRDVKEEKLSEQLQFARYMEKDTTGQSIFLVVAEGFKEKGIPLRNLINAVTDGDLEMAY
ncbi:serine/threonine-protein kinase RIO3 [Trichinella spiralis]|uniref:serine/threonine-protein kinase RIO3 n=1 Tax=Trichinella spiralis TaxID=6334 RepID=UPI0001EFD1A3|nr:serine/threonine-protein kinase RIO3 [Trichinella spiralis]